uniref:hypothetical protein n=1 Tax=Streptosporangium amethystogenes TaxID=2002 RepID=UPI0004C94C53
MNTPPERDDTLGCGCECRCGPASPITSTPPTAVEYAQDLAAVLAELHHIHADVHELTSGNAILTAARQLAEHHAILNAKDDVVRNGLPLPADVIGAEHVD